MEVIAEIILAGIWEFLLQIISQILIEFGFGSLTDAARQRTRAHPAVAILGVLVLGGLVGAVTSFIVPTRILPSSSAMRGASLVLSPLAAGVAMHAYGRWKEQRGSERSFLASFWGGALFAFGMALIRLIWVSQ